ncbi:MAG: UDP-glucose 4-epimerase GalE [Jatrophihabitans sp.]
MRVLVTGGAGYIGSVITAQLLAEGHEAVVVDDLSTGHADAVPQGAEFHQLPITALDQAIGDWGIEAAIHLAARSLVGESVAEPSMYWRNNVIGTVAMLDSLHAFGVDRIVFSSSASVYGQPDRQPIAEDAATGPTSPYGSTKLAIDLALTDYAHSYAMTAVSLRYFNVAGALRATSGHWFGERHTTETHLIPNALRAAGGTGEALSLFGTDYPTDDGTGVRDYVHVVDLAAAHVSALTAGAPGEHHVVNLGSGTGCSVRQVLDTVREVTGRDVPVIEVGRRAGDPPVLIASNIRASELLGWAPERDLTQIVSDAWDFEQSRTPA